MEEGQRRTHMPVDLLKPTPRRRQAPVPSPTAADRQRAQALGLEALAPAVLWPAPTQGRYEILAGVVTWRLAQELGEETVPVRWAPHSETIADELVAAEYVGESALGLLDTVLEAYADGHGETPPAIAKRLGVDRTLVWHLVRLRQLTPSVMAELRAGRIKVGHARLVASRSGPEQERWTRKVIAEGWSVHALRAAMRGQPRPQASGGTASSEHPDPNVRHLLQRLTELLGTRVELQPRGESGAGTLVLHYANMDILDGLLERLGYQE